jgi:hypothetical protein
MKMITPINVSLNVNGQYFFLPNLTYLLTHGAEAFLRSRQLCSHSRISQRFMEPEGSLPPSQEPSIGPYPEPIVMQQDA